MVRPKRSEQTVNLNTEIKAIAWKQIAEHGAAALSLRRIARALGIAAPSIYHYYGSRDDLVTALILDAFNSLGKALHDSIASSLSDDHSARLTSLGLAYRQWAISQPQRYQLIFGTPIPGYVAPEELTLPAATAGFVPLISVLQDALTAGRLRVERLVPLSPALKSMLEAWKKSQEGFDIEVLYMALIFWSRAHGLMMFEINGQYPSFITDASEVYAREMNQIINLYF
jgi:AcrR family transcriptional regulator